MLENIRLGDLYIGDTDGNAEAQTSNFTELFFDINGKYNEILNDNNKFLIVGDKGTGKTYLAHYICKRKKENQFYTIQDAKKYWIVELINKSEGVNSKQLLCKWFLLQTIAKYIVEKIHPIKAKYFPFTSAYKLREFLEKNESLDLFKPCLLSTETSEMSEIGMNGGMSGTEGSLGAACKTSVGQNTKIESVRREFYEHIDPFEKLVKKAIENTDDIMMIFDDLDELDKHMVENPMTNDMILNLIKCVRDINYDFRRDNKKLRLVLLLRTDIVEKLQQFDSNLNKLVTSNGVDLYWLISDRNVPEQHPLMKMIIHKARTSCDKLSSYSDREVFVKLFPESIDGKAPLQYLLDLSFGRPRDFILYLNHIIKAYPGDRFFSASAMKAVRPLYSADLFNELKNQLLFHKEPGYTEECFKMLREIGKPTFSYDDAMRYYSEKKEGLSYIDDLDESLAFMYSNGILGNVWTKNNRQKYFAWAYRRDAADVVDLKKNFTVHPGLRKKLSI